ncbi:hypothetical protein [Salidesulfovibrio brasiliensis]|uniref:hypothetical protein n=1 Tax=Salidesulfovibrio brasiliensis TaxID=221711 RepID=UPI0006D0CEC3|nr:hypothetical protein [Salidesulfovibrio brasiliensis]
MTDFKPFSITVDFQSKEEAFAMLAVCYRIAGLETQTHRKFFNTDDGPCLGQRVEEALSEQGIEVKHTSNFDEVAEMAYGKITFRKTN